MDIIMRLCNNYFEYLRVNFTEKFLLSFIKKKKKLDSIGIQKKMIEKKKSKVKGMEHENEMQNK